MSIAEAPDLLVAKQATAAERPRWWTQSLLIGLVWWSYDAINNRAPLRAASAVANGVSILRVETTLHLDLERGLNHWLSSHLSLGRWLGDYYNLAHFGVTIGVLLWVWWRHPQRYRPLRNGLLGINLIGFLVFWLYPVAPPRMLSGFTDIVAVANSFGDWTSGSLASQANEYAAMPSLHVAWALWCTLAVWVIRKDRGARAVAGGYAVLTSVVVMATANHYLLDVVAGAATAAVACIAVVLGLARGWRRSPEAATPA